MKGCSKSDCFGGGRLHAFELSYLPCVGSQIFWTNGRTTSSAKVITSMHETNWKIHILRETKFLRSMFVHRISLVWRYGEWDSTIKYPSAWTNSTDSTFKVLLLFIYINYINMRWGSASYEQKWLVENVLFWMAFSRFTGETLSIQERLRCVWNKWCTHLPVLVVLYRSHPFCDPLFPWPRCFHAVNARRGQV